VANRKARRGKLYDKIEQVLGTKLGPSGWLSEDAYRFWNAGRLRRWLANHPRTDRFPSQCSWHFLTVVTMPQLRPKSDLTDTAEVDARTVS